VLTRRTHLFVTLLDFVQGAGYLFTPFSFVLIEAAEEEAATAA
jgi:hypothetical protein